MKKRLLFFVFFSVFFGSLFAQSVSFSYFFPTNGYFSNPVAPLKLSLPLSFGTNFEISPGLALYSIGGMNLENLPNDLKSDKPLAGPFQSFNVNLVPTVVIPSGDFSFDVHAGMFVFKPFNVKILKGNFEDMLKEHYKFQALSSDVNLKNKSWGWGYIFGLTVNFKVTKTIWAFVGSNYYQGSKAVPLEGSYQAAGNGKPLAEYNFDFPGTKLDYKGFDISFGVTLKKK
jgi:hypothetical protein